MLSVSVGSDLPVLSELSELHQAVLAAALAVGCSCAILMAGDAMRWSEVERCGDHLPCDVADHFEANLRTATTYGDIVSISGGDYPLQAEQHRRFIFDPAGTLLSVAIRGDGISLCGALVLGHPDRKLSITAAQRYALQTHAAAIAKIVTGGSKLSHVVGTPVDRLRLLESVVINAKDSIIITEAEPIDLPGPRIVYANPAFERTTGYTPQEVIGKTPRMLQSGSTDRAALDDIRAALEKWQPIEIELINARKDGTEFWVELSIVPVADEKGWYTHWISVQRDISERKEAEKLAQAAQASWEQRVALESRLQERERISVELQHAAFHDKLTSLHNRAYMMARLDAVLKMPLHSCHATALFIDLDGFKLVNDSLGHMAGDELLGIVARRLQMSSRSDDVLARLGGDEFGILITGESHAFVAAQLAQRIIDCLNEPVALRGQDVVVSCSIGLVSADGSYVRPEDLLRDADVAMYSAKKEGRGRFAWFDASMRDAAVTQLTMQNALRHAVAEHDFVVFYQPLYAGSDGRLVAVEALLRWNHPQLGIVRPDRFVSLAEDLGLIHQLGAWVMKKAAQDVHAWRTRFPLVDLALNVNVSGKELTRPGYLGQVVEILEATSLPPRSLQIEVTESVFLMQPELVASVLAGVRALDVKVGLDDFGTGYSSMSYIDQYPIDAIKIDKSFVSRMMHLPRSRAIVESILSLGRSLELNVVAEGVETPGQLALLKGMHCPCLQGYLLSMPVESHKIDALLEMEERTQRKDIREQAFELGMT